MKIDIIVDKHNAHVRFDKPTINFPFVFSFFDRLGHVLIEVNLDLEAFKHFYEELEKKIDLEKLKKISA